ncbi:hypothetical protein [Vibrio sp. R78045]|uniref:hypothetical protein n=1 Tax=Vibrio sp. R78045 TaxID=3093868 RepID=UPI0036F44B14
MQNELLHDYAKDYISKGFACDYDGSINSLIPSIVIYGDDKQCIEIMVGTLAMQDFARRVIKLLKMSFIYRLFAHNDYGNQSIFVESLLPLEDMRDACRYITLKGEEILEQEYDEEATSPEHFAVAATLIAHYGCATGLNESDAIELEMHSIREGSGHFKDADERFEQWIPSCPESMMKTLRLFVGSTNGLGNVNCHYAKYKIVK